MLRYVLLIALVIGMVSPAQGSNWAEVSAKHRSGNNFPICRLRLSVRVSSRER